MSDDNATIESSNLNISNFKSDKESILSEYIVRIKMIIYQ